MSTTQNNNSFSAQLETLAASQEDVVVNEAEKLDKNEVITPEKLAKQRAKFNLMVKDSRHEHVNPYTQTYRNKAGKNVEVEIEECDPMLYILHDQPNEMPITANATETRGGTAPMAD